RARRAPGKPRSVPPRPCPKENGPAAPRRPPDPRDGSSGDSTKGRGRGAARGTPEASGAPPAAQNGAARSGVPAEDKGQVRGAPPAPTKLLAMDCEMVGTGPGGRTSALARCSIVTYEGD
ncbi:AEN nuclease, partial [Smithornis capensis]|nr:AEN nuclease [Smithornis capensis]